MVKDGAFFCSFCGKSQNDIKNLIAGPSVYICDECTTLCVSIILEKCDESDKLNFLNSLDFEWKKYANHECVETNQELSCTFCGKGPKNVRLLITGGISANICDECAKRCGNIINQEQKCAFCGKDQKNVRQLITGISANICDECIELCEDLINKNSNKSVSLETEREVNDDSVSDNSLQQAVKNGDSLRVKQLIDEGVFVDDTEWNRYGSPLHVAAIRGYLEIAEMLIKAGAYIDLKNADIGATPLMKAVENEQTEMVKYLIDQGADINATNHDGATALMYARCTREDKRNEIVTILLAHEAR